MADRLTEEQIAALEAMPTHAEHGEEGFITIRARLRDALLAEVRAYHLLREAVNAHGDHCTPECSSLGHSEKCKSFDPAAMIVALRRHVEELQEKMDPDHACACSYDRPGEVCAVHSPENERLKAEVRALREEVEALRPERVRAAALMVAFNELRAGVDALREQNAALARVLEDVEETVEESEWGGTSFDEKDGTCPECHRYCGYGRIPAEHVDGCKHLAMLTRFRAALAGVRAGGPKA